MNRSQALFRTEHQAADWLVRLDSDVSPETQAAFRRWLESDLRHRAIYVRLERGWRNADRLAQLRPLNGNVNLRVLDGFPGDKTLVASSALLLPKAWLTRTLRVATVVASLVLAIWLLASAQQWRTYRTEVGGFQRIPLKDGSRVLLNTNSQIRVRMNSKSREIVLDRGEALFDVAHDARRPFDVHAGKTIVHAVGTAFAIHMQDQSKIDVLVTNGRVTVDHTGSRGRTSAPLPEGEFDIIDDQQDRAEHLTPQDIAHHLAWTQGRIWLQHTTLADAVIEFNRYNNSQLSIVDPAIASWRVGGLFEATDPEAFVAALTRVLPVSTLPPAKEPSGAEVICLTGANNTSTR